FCGTPFQEGAGGTLNKGPTQHGAGAAAVTLSALPESGQRYLAMAKTNSAKFVRPDADTRAAQVAKTTRLRTLRLAKEADDAGNSRAHHSPAHSCAMTSRRPRSPR